MVERLENILENAKVCYRESVLIRNNTLEESLLNIISDANILIKDFESNKKFNNKISKNKIKDENDEIERIHRKIPQWLYKPNQINHKILVAYMKISNSNTYPVSVSLLEKSCEIDSRKFISNYNQMKIISPKNNAKVFEEIDGHVSLWIPVADFIISEYEKIIR